MTCDEPSPQHPQDKQIKTIRQIIRELISNFHIQAKHNMIEAKKLHTSSSKWNLTKLKHIRHKQQRVSYTIRSKLTTKQSFEEEYKNQNE